MSQSDAAVWIYYYPITGGGSCTVCLEEIKLGPKKNIQPLRDHLVQEHPECDVGGTAELSEPSAPGKRGRGRPPKKEMNVSDVTPHACGGEDSASATTSAEREEKPSVPVGPQAEPSQLSGSAVEFLPQSTAAPINFTSHNSEPLPPCLPKAKKGVKHKGSEVVPEKKDDVMKDADVSANLNLEGAASCVNSDAGMTLVPTDNVISTLTDYFERVSKQKRKCRACGAVLGKCVMEQAMHLRTAHATRLIRGEAYFESQSTPEERQAIQDLVVANEAARSKGILNTVQPDDLAAHVSLMLRRTTLVRDHVAHFMTRALTDLEDDQSDSKRSLGRKSMASPAVNAQLDVSEVKKSGDDAKMESSGGQKLAKASKRMEDDRSKKIKNEPGNPTWDPSYRKMCELVRGFVGSLTLLAHLTSGALESLSPDDVKKIAARSCSVKHGTEVIMKDDVKIGHSLSKKLESPLMKKAKFGNAGVGNTPYSGSKIKKLRTSGRIDRKELVPNAGTEKKTSDMATKKKRNKSVNSTAESMSEKSKRVKLDGSSSVQKVKVSPSGDAVKEPKGRDSFADHDEKTGQRKAGAAAATELGMKRLRDQKPEPESSRKKVGKLNPDTKKTSATPEHLQDDEKSIKTAPTKVPADVRSPGGDPRESVLKQPPSSAKIAAKQKSRSSFEDILTSADSMPSVTSKPPKRPRVSSTASSWISSPPTSTTDAAGSITDDKNMPTAGMKLSWKEFVELQKTKEAENVPLVEVKVEDDPGVKRSGRPQISGGDSAGKSASAVGGTTAAVTFAGRRSTGEDLRESRDHSSLRRRTTGAIIAKSAGRAKAAFLAAKKSKERRHSELLARRRSRTGGLRTADKGDDVITYKDARPYKKWAVERCGETEAKGGESEEAHDSDSELGDVKSSTVTAENDVALNVDTRERREKRPVDKFSLPSSPRKYKKTTRNMILLRLKTDCEAAIAQADQAAAGTYSFRRASNLRGGPTKNVVKYRKSIASSTKRSPPTVKAFTRTRAKSESASAPKPVQKKPAPQVEKRSGDDVKQKDPKSEPPIEDTMTNIGLSTVAEVKEETVNTEPTDADYKLGAEDKTLSETATASSAVKRGRGRPPKKRVDYLTVSPQMHVIDSSMTTHEEGSLDHTNLSLDLDTAGYGNMKYEPGPDNHSDVLAHKIDVFTAVRSRSSDKVETDARALSGSLAIDTLAPGRAAADGTSVIDGELHTRELSFEDAAEAITLLNVPSTIPPEAYDNESILGNDDSDDSEPDSDVSIEPEAERKSVMMNKEKVRSTLDAGKDSTKAKSQPSSVDEVSKFRKVTLESFRGASADDSPASSAEDSAAEGSSSRRRRKAVAPRRVDTKAAGSSRQHVQIPKIPKARDGGARPTPRASASIDASGNPLLGSSKAIFRQPGTTVGVLKNVSPKSTKSLAESAAADASNASQTQRRSSRPSQQVDRFAIPVPEPKTKPEGRPGSDESSPAKKPASGLSHKKDAHGRGAPDLLSPSRPKPGLRPTLMVAGRGGSVEEYVPPPQVTPPTTVLEAGCSKWSAVEPAPLARKLKVTTRLSECGTSLLRVSAYEIPTPAASETINISPPSAEEVSRNEKSVLSAETNPAKKLDTKPNNEYLNAEAKASPEKKRSWLSGPKPKPHVSIALEQMKKGPVRLTATTLPKIVRKSQSSDSETPEAISKVQKVKKVKESPPVKKDHLLAQVAGSVAPVGSSCWQGYPASKHTPGSSPEKPQVFKILSTKTDRRKSSGEEVVTEFVEVQCVDDLILSALEKTRAEDVQEEEWAKNEAARRLSSVEMCSPMSLTKSEAPQKQTDVAALVSGSSSLAAVASPDSVSGNGRVRVGVVDSKGAHLEQAISGATPGSLSVHASTAKSHEEEVHLLANSQAQPSALGAVVPSLDEDSTKTGGYQQGSASGQPANQGTPKISSPSGPPSNQPLPKTTPPSQPYLSESKEAPPSATAGGSGCLDKPGPSKKPGPHVSQPGSPKKPPVLPGLQAAATADRPHFMGLTAEEEDRLALYVSDLAARGHVIPKTFAPLGGRRQAEKSTSAGESAPDADASSAAEDDADAGGPSSASGAEGAPEVAGSNPTSGGAAGTTTVVDSQWYTRYCEERQIPNAPPSASTGFLDKCALLRKLC